MCMTVYPILLNWPSWRTLFVQSCMNCNSDHHEVLPPTF